jgi:hypothetical protein
VSRKNWVRNIAAVLFCFEKYLRNIFVAVSRLSSVQLVLTKTVETLGKLQASNLMRRQLQASCFVPCLCSFGTGVTYVSSKPILNTERKSGFPRMPYSARGRVLLRLFCVIADDSTEHHSITERTGEENPSRQSTSSTALPDIGTTTSNATEKRAHPSVSQRVAAHVPVLDNILALKRVARSEAIVELVSFLRIISLSMLLGIMLCSIDIVIGLVVFTAGSAYAVSELFAFSIGARTALRVCRGFARAVWDLLRHSWLAGKRKVDKILKD